MGPPRRRWVSRISPLSGERPIIAPHGAPLGPRHPASRHVSSDGCGRARRGILQGVDRAGLNESPRKEVNRMKVVQEMIEVSTSESQQFLDITKRVRDAVSRSAIRNGVMVVNSLHTTLALFI